MTDEAWNRVAEVVAARRRALALTQEEAATAAGVSDQTWSLLERGARDSYRVRTKRGIAEAMGWAPDAIDRILAGDEPDPDPPTSPAGAMTPDFELGFAALDGVPVTDEERELAAAFIRGRRAATKPPVE